MLRVKKFFLEKFFDYLVIPAIILAFFVFCFQAATADTALEGLNKAASQGFLGTGDPADLKEGTPGIIVSIPGTIGKVVGAGLALIGVIFLVLMIYGGFIWMTARGNEQQTTKAKELILAAIVGVIIVLSAYAITLYVSSALTP